jgi:hypothetical protein
MEVITVVTDISFLDSQRIEKMGDSWKKWWYC